MRATASAPIAAASRPRQSFFCQFPMTMWRTRNTAQQSQGSQRSGVIAGELQVERERATGRQVRVDPVGIRLEHLRASASRASTSRRATRAEVAPPSEHVERAARAARRPRPRSRRPAGGRTRAARADPGPARIPVPERVEDRRRPNVRDPPLVPHESTSPSSPSTASSVAVRLHLGDATRFAGATTRWIFVRATHRACDDSPMHEDLIRSARRRIRIATAAGLLVLTLTMAAIVLPVAWSSAPRRTCSARGSATAGISSRGPRSVSTGVGIVVAAGRLRLVARERRGDALEFVRAWPGPRASAEAAAAPPSGRTRTRGEAPRRPGPRSRRATRRTSPS